MTTVLPFGSNTIQVYAYEGFNYTISNPDPLSTLQPVSNSGGLNPTSLYFTQNDNDSYTFAVSDLQNNLTASGTPEQFVLSLSTGSNSVNNVVINPGRFLDSNSNSLSNTSYTFYKSEPIPRIRLVAPSFTLKQPTSVPTLPPGLSFVNVASNIYDISGIPLVTVPNSNYQIIGVQQGGSKVVTTRINIAISNERVQLNVSDPVVSGMTIGTPITPRVLSAIPPVGTSVLRYTFPTLPDGIVVTDVSGVIKTSPFFPTDSSYTMIVSGTPTSNAAYAFANAGATSNGFTYNVLASRTVPSPLVENTQPFQFAFGETVLFDQTTVPPLYVGVPVDSSSVFFRAQTYFTSNVDISNITALSLPAGLSLNYVGSGRANLTGTPTAVGSASYTIRATNSNGVTRDYTTSINVSNDTVSFSSPVGVDLCYSFILSRPVNQAKAGYYPSNIQFVASSSSGRNVTLSAPALSGTGLSLDSNGIITGIPTTITPLTDLNVVATVAGSPATATKTVKFSVLDDVFTFADVSSTNFQFIENVGITPFQFPVTTLSGRNIVNFAQTGLPSGLTLNPAGVLSGTPSSSSPTQGNASIVASTGFASGSRDFSYNIIPDSMLFIVNPTEYTFQAGNPIGNINVDAVAYSGTTISRYDLSINPTYGMTINPTTGVISGTWTDSIPPNNVLPASCNFSVNATAGSLLGVLPVELSANPVVSNIMPFAVYGDIGGMGPPIKKSVLYYLSPSNPSTFQKVYISNVPGLQPGEQTVSVHGAISDIRLKNTSPLSNVLLATTTGSDSYGGLVLRGTTLGNVTAINLDPDDQTYTKWSKVVNKTGTSTWWLAGRLNIIDGPNAGFIRSDDDGLNWDLSSAAVFSNSSGERIWARDSNGSVGWVGPHDAYLTGGVALAYKDGILMAGGLHNSNSGTQPIMLRSTNDGNTWNNVVGQFGQECANYSLENPSVWVVTGSGAYKSIDRVPSTGSPAPFSSPTTTIKYSTDQGANWSDASGGFNMFGYDLVYANNTWLATGVQVSSNNPVGPFYYSPQLRYSTDGSNWAVADLSSTLFNPSNTVPLVAPLRLGSIAFDGTRWNVFVNAESNVSGGGGSIPFLFQHDASSSLSSNWTFVDLSQSLVPNYPIQNSNTRYLAIQPPVYLYTGQPPINIHLTFSSIIPPGGGGGGPTFGFGPEFTSPTTRSFIQYQYIPISPIQISADGYQTVYFFVQSDDLPDGLVFNRNTGQITGTPTKAGQDTVTIYAKDGTNIVSSIVLQFTTLVPRVIRKQDGAGAYTSLLRQYTEVLGAQNARDNRVLPNQERRLGEFMSPEAPDVITQTIDPKCLNPNC